MHRLYPTIVQRTRLLAFTICCALAGMPSFTQADVTHVVVQSSGPMGMFQGRAYIWVKAMMTGNVKWDSGKVGRYRVPVVLMYPDRDPNNFGFVDLINSAAFALYKDGEAPSGQRRVFYNGDHIFSDYLRRQGFTYIAVQWSRMVTHVLGDDYGVIENGLDGYEIVKDATRFLRQPNTLEGALPFRPQAVGHVLGVGYSQTARLLRQMVRTGQNREANGALIFDGILAGVQAACLVLNNDETPRPEPGPTNPTFGKFAFCPDPLPEDGKFITLLSQSDVGLLKGYLTRHQTPSYRQYELAGVAHIPSYMLDMGLVGVRRQNPVTHQPVFKAMLRNLVDWIVTGKSPAASAYLEGAVDGAGKFRYTTDADGNVKGGVRLPHMPTVLANGERVGAPLGVYTGLNPDYLEPRD